MVTLADLRQWDPAALHAVYDDVQRAEQDLMHTGDDFIAAGNPLQSWVGVAAEAARQEHQGLTSALSHGVAGLRLLMKTLGELMDAVPALHRTIEEAEELARKYGYQVGENGEITDALTNPGKHDPHPDDRAAARAEIEATLQQVVRTGTDIDADLTRVLKQIGEGEVGTGGETTTTAAAAHGAAAQSLTLPEPPPGATAAQNAAWWSTLSPNAQALMLGNRPALVGGLDGLPAELRSRANMAALPDVRAQLQRRLDEIRRQTAEDHPDHRQTTVTSTVLAEESGKLQARLDALNAIEGNVTSTANAPESDRYYLLDIDGSGDGQAIVSKGNPDTADNVATYIPGTGSELGNMQDHMDRSERMHASATLSNPDASTAVVSYMGYDAPNNLPVATDQSYAENAKEDLSRFQEGLRESHEGPPSHNTVVGHSYGFVTAAIAAREGDGLPVDDLMAVAAPGATVDHANQLNTSDDHVWATVNDSDKVNDQPFHGEDPTDPEFGGRVFESSPAQSESPHSEYWDRDNRALKNMGHIITGSYSKVTE